jgi:predicted ATPase/DNA-binding SARP family transcriptional activator/tetratricopeptide (TPR) repeat protein
MGPAGADLVAGDNELCHACQSAVSVTSMQAMELRVLGPFEMVADDGQLMDVGGHLARALLVALALAEGHAVPADQLLDQAWPGGGVGDRNRLQVHMSRLRKVLGSGRILTQAGGYSLRLPAGGLDAARFDQLAAAGRAALQRQDAAEAARVLRQALGLWRGRPLGEFADAPFAAPVVTRLEEARLTATEDRIEAELILGAHGELTGELEALVQEHPLRERLWGQLMLALYRSDRQGDALGAYQRARTVLAEELGVDPGPALRKLEAAVLGQDPALDAPAIPPAYSGERRAGNLPAAPSPLIGRASELHAIAGLLGPGRLVTVTGTGGAGKSRLAIEVARSLVGAYRDGVWMVELAPAGDDAAVADTAGAVLGVAPPEGRGTGMLERLGDFLARRHALLILDNCEHVIAGAARAAEYLLARCPELQILATSRESLAVAGESLWPLQPLAIEAASELFIARATASAPGLLADENTMTTIAAICARLDGLPLAVELAAARMRALAPGDILDRLADQFRLLTGGSRTAVPRHRTLRAVIDWSYDLLFEDERRVFERMSAFAGPCSLEAAEQVCAGSAIAPDDVADLLARLVDKSLISATQTSRGVRFRVLQTLAEYGRERLAGRGELATVSASHSRWAASIADVSDSAHGPAWFASVREFVSDIRRAMESALDAGDCDISLAIVCGIGWFWAMAGAVSGEDCWQWLTASLALPQPDTGRRVRVLAMAEQVALAQGRSDALSYGEQAVELGQKIGDRPARAFAVWLHGSALSGVFGERERAIGLLEEAGALLEAEADDWSLGLAAMTRGVAALARRDLRQSQVLLRGAADLFARTGDALPRGAALRHLADLAVLRGSYGNAISALEEMLSVLPAKDHPAAIARMAQLGCLYAFQDRYEQSGHWHARAEALAGEQQHPHMLVFARNARGLSLRLRGRLSEAEDYHLRALELCRDHAVPEGLAMAHVSLGYISEVRGDAVAAERHHRASLQAACEVADRQAQAAALDGLAAAAALRDDAHAAGRLLAAASAFREGTVGTVMGQGTAMRETIIGRLLTAERAGINRATPHVSDGAAYDAGYAEGAGDPVAVLSAARG